MKSQELPKVSQKDAIEIAKILRRDHRTIWRFVANSQQCHQKRVKIKKHR